MFYRQVCLDFALKMCIRDRSSAVLRRRAEKMIE